MKVLHFKSNFLNYSETFIKRLVHNHQNVSPVAMCVDKRDYTDLCPLFEMPQKGISGFINKTCFHLNWCLPFYIDTIKKEEPQIIHAHFGFDGYRMIKPSQKTNLPLIVSFYGSDVSRLPREFDWKRRYQKLAKHGDTFIAASEHMRRQLIDLGFPQSKIVVIRFGIDLDHFTFSNSYSSDQPLMIAGRIVEKKGFTYALKAIKLLKDEGNSLKLNVYGDGVLLNDLKEKAKQWKIDHLVTFHGKVAIEEIRKQYHQHSMLLVPSITANDGDQEGIPNTILEGMASGIPIVSTHHAGINEAVIQNKTGFLVEEQNAKTLSETVLNVKNSGSSIDKIRRNARQFVEENYELKRMVREVENVYKNNI